MDFKFIHASDIHLDSPLVGLEQYEGAPVSYVRGATRRALENLVDLALAEEVDFVVIAGDLYDGNWRDYNTGLFFVSQMARLNQAGIGVCMVRGNHDAASQITHRLRLPDNCTDFPTTRPDTVILASLGVAIHGQGFPHAACYEDLSQNYPEPNGNYFHIGLLHTSANGRPGHDSYAPSDLNYLKNKGYNYWALGHVHRAEVLAEDPWIVFPGNVQGRHIREEGAKGCALVTVTGDGVQVEHRPLDVLRWRHCSVDVSGAHNYDQVLEVVLDSMDTELAQSEGRCLALRMVLSGACPIHSQLVGDVDQLGANIRALAVDRGPDSLWVEKVKVKTHPVSWGRQALEHHPVASLLAYFEEFGRDEEFLLQLAEELVREANALPAEVFAEEEEDWTNPRFLAELLPHASEIIRSRLLQREGLDHED